MKIAYITLHKVRNYGSVLQTYATYKILKNLGHEPILIDYCSPRFIEKNRIDDEFRRFKHPKKNNSIIKPLFYFVMSVSVKKQRKQFESFLSSEMLRTKPYYDLESLKSDPPDADVYCTGSDQVWNIDGNRFFERPFYLDFGAPSIKRIALSASFGRTQLNEEELSSCRELFGHYSAIGVREASGLSILKELGVENCENTLDPTMILDSDEWIKMTSETPMFKKKYILVYEFNKTSNIKQYAKELSRRTGLPIKRITYWYHERHKGEDCVVLPNVCEFLTLIRHAEYVITNSFHATVFSTVFKRKFATVYPEYGGVRLEDYLRLTGMLERHISNPADIGAIDKSINYDEVYSKLEQEREKTLFFLQRAIKGDI